MARRVRHFLPIPNGIAIEHLLGGVVEEARSV
jgi:hypothetical protein